MKSDISTPADTLLVPNTANISAELEITLLFTFSEKHNILD